MSEIDTKSCYMLVGSIVRQALLDYWRQGYDGQKISSAKTPSDKNTYHNKENWHLDAKNFLFKENRLEDFLQFYHIDSFVNAREIRLAAKRKRFCYFKFTDNFSAEHRAQNANKGIICADNQEYENKNIS